MRRIASASNLVVTSCPVKSCHPIARIIRHHYELGMIKATAGQISGPLEIHELNSRTRNHPPNHRYKP